MLSLMVTEAAVVFSGGDDWDGEKTNIVGDGGALW